MQTAAIILAAGSSSRMGRPKQMLDIQGEILLQRIIRIFLQVRISKIVVVLGSEEQTLRTLIKDLPVDVVHNTNWESGMGSSIREGLQHLVSEYPQIESVMVSVCDQPLLSGKIISGLIARHLETGSPVVASQYSGAPGVPALFQKIFFKELMALHNNEGAKKIILGHLSDASLVPFPGGEIDLDTPEDYRSYVERINKTRP